jgi:hypothetical protein
MNAPTTLTASAQTYEERTAAYHARTEAMIAVQSAEYEAKRHALALKGWGTMWLNAKPGADLPGGSSTPEGFSGGDMARVFGGVS